MTSVEADAAAEVVTVAAPAEARPGASEAPEERRRNRRGVVRTGGAPARPAPVTSPGANTVHPGATAGGRQAQLVSDVAPRWDSRAAPLASGAPMSFERHDRHGGGPAWPGAEPEHPSAPVDLAPLATLAMLPLLLAGSLLPALLGPLLQAFGLGPGAGTGVAGAGSNPSVGNGFAPSGTNGYSPAAYQPSYAPAAYQPMGGYGQVGLTPQAVLDFLNRVRNDLFGNGATTNGVRPNGFGEPGYGNPGRGATFDSYRGARQRADSAARSIERLTADLRTVIGRYGQTNDENRRRIDDLIREFQDRIRDANRLSGQAREREIQRILQETVERAQRIIGGENTNAAQTAADVDRLTRQYLADVGRAAPNSTAGAIPLSEVRYDREAFARGRDAYRQHISDALDAMGITDPEARDNWTRGYMTAAERESSYNPLSVNTWDSNAYRLPGLGPDGYPAGSSRGGLQTIPETFARYHQPGTSTNIYDPAANIAASMNYVMGRYGVSPDGSNLGVVSQFNPYRRARGY